MTAHTFWRFRVTENNGGDTVLFSDFTLSIAPFTADLSALAQITTSATQRNFEFQTPQQVGAYSLTATGGTAPKAWVFEYSDDGVIWTIAALQYAQRNWQANDNRHFACELFELSLSVNGSNAAPYFNAFIHDTGGELIFKKIVYNGEITFLMPNQNPVSVTVTQEFGTTWQSGRYYSAGVLVAPSNPQTMPFYFRNRKTGISDLVEPTWSTDPQILNHDSTCVWELVERLNQPITQSPLIPTRKLS